MLGMQGLRPAILAGIDALLEDIAAAQSNRSASASRSLLWMETPMDAAQYMPAPQPWRDWLSRLLPPHTRAWLDWLTALLSRRKQAAAGRRTLVGLSHATHPRLLQARPAQTCAN